MDSRGAVDAPARHVADLGGSAVRVLAVDGNSLGHRAFHSTREDAGARDDAVPLVTGGLVSMLASAWINGPYDAVIVAFDHPTNHRREQEPDYKANRPPTPPELRESLVALRTHLRACGFHVEEQEGAEADDLLAAVAERCGPAGWSCDLLSSDRDLLACVDTTTRLLRPQARFSDLLVEDVAGVRARYGIEPAQYVDLAALRGDPSDGLVGATGIGRKTAAKLLRTYGSVLGIYAALGDLPPRIEASLREARARIERNLLLMAPFPHLDVDVASAVATGIRLELAVEVLRGLGLDAAARRLRRAVLEPPPPRPPFPPPDDEPSVARPVRRLPPLATTSLVEQVSLF